MMAGVMDGNVSYCVYTLSNWVALLGHIMALRIPYDKFKCRCLLEDTM
jgi:hypothetical protein